jgi:hypothetical protein
MRQSVNLAERAATSREACATGREGRQLDRSLLEEKSKLWFQMAAAEEREEERRSRGRCPAGYTGTARLGYFTARLHAPLAEARPLSAALGVLIKSLRWCAPNSNSRSSVAIFSFCPVVRSKRGSFVDAALAPGSALVRTDRAIGGRALRREGGWRRRELRVPQCVGTTCVVDRTHLAGRRRRAVEKDIALAKFPLSARARRGAPSRAITWLKPQFIGPPRP